jgi:hypothetical protein
MPLSTRTATLILLIFFVLLGCATEEITYYKYGGDQYTFELESRQCLDRAKASARVSMADPAAEPDPMLVQKDYEECLYTQGWSKIPLDQRQRSLWTWEEKTLHFGDVTFDLPSGFSLLTETKWVIGPAWSHDLQAAGPEKKTHLILQAQESIDDPIQTAPFPRPEGFVYYTGDRLGKFNIRWSVFVGSYERSMVAVLGTYIHLGETRRISVIFSRALSAPGPAVEGYALSLPQKKELDELYPRWVSWIKTQTGALEIEKKPGFGRYFQFIW